MHAVFFEVLPHPGHLDHYFAHVARLKPVLARHSGLAFLDRYGALAQKDMLLSHQLWETEAAITAWRTDTVHRSSQAAGRHVHFADYRIRVGVRVLHWQVPVAAGQMQDAAGLDGAGAADGAHVLAVYGTQAVTAPGFAAFESVNQPGNFIALASFDGLDAARAAFDAQAGAPGVHEAGVFRTLRDYGQFQREQAPPQG